MWSMWACVITIAFTVRPRRASVSSTLAISSPGSTTSASPVCSSPKMEQLHKSGPTGRISWIIRRLYTHGMLDVLQVIMLYLHFSSLAVLLGGVAYWRMVLMPSTLTLTEEERTDLSERDAAAFRPFVLAAVAGLAVSGTFNVLAFPGHHLTHNIV